MSRSANVAVIGQGYVGLPLAVAAAESGNRVVGIDVSNDLVHQLNSGKSHVEDVTEIQLKNVLSNFRYWATTDSSQVSDADVIILCVPTPLDRTNQPDLRYIESGVRLIAPFVKSGSLLVSESTSYPGTVRDFIKPLLEKLRPELVELIHYASAPERVDPMNTVWNMKSTPRLVAGLTDVATDLAHNFYSGFCEKVIRVTSPEVAESAKLLENTFRQVNIALVNQLVPLCKHLGIDIREVVEAAGSKPYGFMKFYPGAGVGGHCIPIDPLYLLWRSRQLGFDLPFISIADKINREMPLYVADRLISTAALESGDTVLLLGVAYKAGISDIRESPANQIAEYLLERGISVVWSDPLVDNFEFGRRWISGEGINAAVVITAQPGLPVMELSDVGVEILDCTGVYRGIPGVTQL